MTEISLTWFLHYLSNPTQVLHYLFLLSMERAYSLFQVFCFPNIFISIFVLLIIRVCVTQYNMLLVAIN